MSDNKDSDKVPDWLGGSFENKKELHAALLNSDRPNADIRPSSLNNKERVRYDCQTENCSV